MWHSTTKIEIISHPYRDSSIQLLKHNKIYDTLVSDRYSVAADTQVQVLESGSKKWYRAISNPHTTKTTVGKLKAEAGKRFHFLPRYTMNSE